MGFRVRKSLKIAPGVRVNIGKTGTSLSVGGKGATVNFSKRGMRTTIGIPGTGISYTSTIKSHPQPQKIYSKGEYIFCTFCFLFLFLLGLVISKPFIWVPFGLLSILGVVAIVGFRK